jgi:hypothetical protein
MGRMMIIQELSGHRYPSLQAAQDAAAPVLAQLLVNTIQAGLDSGRYFVENGMVKLSQEGETHECLPAEERLPRLGVLP